MRIDPTTGRPTDAVSNKRNGPCTLCRRFGPVSFHHLIPRRNHRNKWFKKRFTREQLAAGIDVCDDCHRAIHKFIDHKALGRDFNTVEAIRSHPRMATFIDWVSGRDTARVRTRRPR